MIYNLKNESIEGYNESENYSFPKYTSQLINWANQNAQGTRPKVVGQMSELFPVFMNSTDRITIEYWKSFYVQQYPDAFDDATDKIFAQIEKLKEAIQIVDRDMVQRWVEDLIINKTFNGMYVQKAILASLADLWGKGYRLATPEEESRGIDGFVGETPYSIKPDTYKTMVRLSEIIDVKMIYYSKTKSGLRIEVDD